MVNGDSWVCNLCYSQPKTEVIGEIALPYFLMFHEGRYCIITHSQGHLDRDMLLFPEKPFPDPDPNDEHEDNDDPALTQAIEWLHHSSDVVSSWKMTAYSGFCFVDAIIKKGIWERKQYPIFEHFIYGFCAKLVSDWEEKNK